MKQVKHTGFYSKRNWANNSLKKKKELFDDLGNESQLNIKIIGPDIMRLIH